MSVQRRLQLVHSGTEGDWVETALKIAFATTDMKHVDQHFGAARGFAIYAVDPEQFRFVEANEFGELQMDGNEDKLATKIEALAEELGVRTQSLLQPSVATSRLTEAADDGERPE